MLFQEQQLNLGIYNMSLGEFLTCMKWLDGFGLPDVVIVSELPTKFSHTPCQY